MTNYIKADVSRILRKNSFLTAVGAFLLFMLLWYLFILIHLLQLKCMWQRLQVIKFLGENPGACPWDEAKKYFSKSLMSISSEYTLQI